MTSYTVPQPQPPGDDAYLDPSQHRITACTCNPPPDGYKPRNLVVCIDPPFAQNTNIIELHHRLARNEEQLTFYNGEIDINGGPSRDPFRYFKQVIDKKIDSAIDWNFEKVIFNAYKWLSDYYQQGDRIFLFGFSRGAYQVQVLATIIHKVGLLRKGNDHQIPLVYELYTRTNEGGWRASYRFKQTFSRDVRVHFVGVWDTISQVGIVQSKTLPLVHSHRHTCFFRHALALDERRVTFLPEHGIPPDGPAEKATDASQIPRVKEVWFAGSHSDVGGGTMPFRTRHVELADMSLLWMQNESVMAGLHFQESDVEWKFDDINAAMHDPLRLRLVWWIFELLPFRRQKYPHQQKKTWRPHIGKGRAILPGQKIHASVAFRQRRYTPRATFVDNESNLSWDGLVGTGTDWNFSPSLPGEWADFLEMDIYDYISGPYAITRLSDPDLSQADVLHILTRLQFMVTSVRGISAICRVSEAVAALATYLATDSNDAGMKVIVADILHKLATYDNARAALIRRHVVASLVNVLKGNEDTIKSTVANIMLEIMKLDDAGVRIRQLDAIIPMVNSKDNQVRSNALDALENFVKRDDSREAISQPGALPSLVDLLKSTHDRTRTVTCRALCIFAQDKDVRAAICFQSDVFSSLVDILKSGFYWTRGFAVEVFETLARYDDSRAAILQSSTLSLLTDLLKNNFCGTRESAVNVLKVFTKYEDSRVAILQSEALHSVVDVLMDEDKFAHGSAANVLKEFANYKDSQVAVLQSNMFSRLVNLLNSDFHWARVSATNILETFSGDHECRAAIDSLRRA